MNERRVFFLVAYRNECHFIRALPRLSTRLALPQILAEMAADRVARQGAEIVILSGQNFRKKLIRGTAEGQGPFLIN